MKLLIPVTITLLLACGHQREQQLNIMKDLVAMQQARVAQQEIPPPSEDAKRYGQGDALVHYMYERFVKVTALDKEFIALVKESEMWTSPTEWKDPQKVKVLRKKAERLVAVVDEYTQLADETTGEKAMDKIRSFKLGSRFNDEYRSGLQEGSDLLGELKTLMATAKNWGERMVDLLTLVDEKLAKMDGNIPKFEKIEDAERYRNLNYKIQEEKNLLGELAGRYLKRYEEYQKSLESKVQKATEG
jgi:hypothetical protein